MKSALLPTVPTGAQRLLLTGATLIDGTGGEPLRDAEVELADGRIVYAGPRRPAEAGAGAGASGASDAQPAGASGAAAGGVSGAVRTVDLAGRTILPGFIDAHVHLGLDLEDQLANLRRFDSERTFRAAVNARKTLMAGVTTARDLGGVDAGFRDSIAAGLIQGPRLHIALVPLSPTGGHGDHHLPNGTETMKLGAVDPIIDTDDDVRRTVRLLIRSGADAIKVCTTGGVSSPSDTPDDVGVPAEHVALIKAETAKRAGQPVAAHAQGAEGILEALRGGIDSVEHGYGIDDEGIELMLAQGTFLVPTLSSALRVPDPALVPGYLYEKKVKWSAIARERVAAAFAAGVKVALGTDAGICPHGVNLREAAHAVELGLSPMQAIVAGTSNAAQLLRLSDDLGTVEEGKLADLIVVDFDPLADIDSLAEPDNVKAVIQGGALVKDTADWFGFAPVRPALG